MNTLGFDIGGTNLRYAVSPGRFVPTHIPVPKTYSQAIARIAEVARKKKISTIVGGLPGPMDVQKTKLIQCVHLPRWVNKPFKTDLEKASGAQVLLENDNALVGLGEAVQGPGRGHRIVGYIGIGTGIGGSRIVDGTIDANAHGFEPGHHIIDFHVTSHRHPSPHPGDWESFVSGSGIFFQTGKRSETIRSRAFWSLMEDRVAIGLVNAAMFWSPDIFILGGSLMKALTISGIERHFSKRMKLFPRKIPIRKAQFGDFGGLHGAFVLGHQ